MQASGAMRAFRTDPLPGPRGPLLANSGNLWLWQPQVRFEERITFTESAGLAQLRVAAPRVPRDEPLHAGAAPTNRQLREGEQGGGGGDDRGAGEAQLMRPAACG